MQSDSLLILRINQVTPIQISSLHCFQHGLSSGHIGSQRDIVHITQAQKGVDIRLMGLCSQGISEKDHQVNLVICHPGANLLIPPRGPDSTDEWKARWLQLPACLLAW